MNLKKDEFRSLRQGGRTLKEYMDDFCALSRCARDDIDTDAKRKEKFLNGLRGDLKIPLSVAYAPNGGGEIVELVVVMDTRWTTTTDDDNGSLEIY